MIILFYFAVNFLFFYRSSILVFVAPNRSYFLPRVLIGLKEDDIMTNRPIYCLKF